MILALTRSATRLASRRVPLTITTTRTANHRAVSNLSAMLLNVTPAKRNPVRARHWNTIAHKQTRLMSSASDPETFINSTIKSNKVTIFSKTYCPFCTRTKMLFESLGEEAEIIELDERADGSVVQMALQTMTGQRSVPNVFVNGSHLGGNDDTQTAARSGKLAELLGN